MAVSADRQQLLDAIRRTLPNTLGTAQLGRIPRVAKLYEARLWALGYKAGRQLRANPLLCDRDDQPATEVLLRPGPSRLMTRTGNYTHWRFEFDGRRFEVHNGIFLTGLSGEQHEADVALLDARETHRVRTMPPPLQNPRCAHLVLGLEAKHYPDTLPIGIGREFIGLRSDFKRRAALVTPATGGHAFRVVRQHTSAVDAMFDETAPNTQQEAELCAALCRRVRHWNA